VLWFRIRISFGFFGSSSGSGSTSLRIRPNISFNNFPDDKNYYVANVVYDPNDLWPDPILHVIPDPEPILGQMKNHCIHLSAAARLSKTLSILHTLDILHFYRSRSGRNWRDYSGSDSPRKVLSTGSGSYGTVFVQICTQVIVGTGREDWKRYWLVKKGAKIQSWSSKYFVNSKHPSCTVGTVLDNGI
jgi:hypothetical protein